MPIFVSEGSFDEGEMDSYGCSCNQLTTSGSPDLLYVRGKLWEDKRFTTGFSTLRGLSSDRPVQTSTWLGMLQA